MHTQPSRKERRAVKIFSAAERGEYQIKTSLFKTEARSLLNEGFDVIRSIPESKKSVDSIVKWDKPFKGGIPPVVCSYTIGEIETLPKDEMDNWAQELYAIASRVNCENNAKTIIE